jgi:sec-independent protein translocase protein TatC
VSHKPVDESLPFVEHLEELRTRVIHVAASVLFFGTAAYFVQQHIVNLLIRPAHGQHFIYTSPGGGISFLFGVCTDVGIIFSLPVLVYEVLGFLKPLLNHQARRFIGRCMIVSVGLGLLGVAFGYYMGLPLALHFLGHQFSTKQITPLLTISEYMSFVTIYLFGSAMLFQIPLVLIMINRIKPLNPKKLLKYERWVIVIAFIVSALMAPTVNVIDQLVIAGPVIIAYQVGIGIIWWNARKQKRRHPRYYDATLVERDRQNQVDRIRQAEEARTRLLARQEAVSAGRHTSIA